MLSIIRSSAKFSKRKLQRVLREIVFNNKSRCVIIVCSILIFLNYCYISQTPYHERYYKFDTYYNDIYSNRYHINYENNVKYILYWSPYINNRWDYYNGYGFQAFKECQFNKCFATKYRKSLPLERFDAVIFHASYSKQLHGVPHIRSPHQIYIYLNMHPPGYNLWNAQLHTHSIYFFNWTMTYRLDSDIVSPHGYTEERITMYDIPSIESLKNKSGAAWFANDCGGSNSKREVLVKELRNFFKVDIYGKCGQLSRKHFNNRCYKMIERKYKFYLAFENYHCKDYITAELFNVLHRNIVPVVYNKGMESHLLPPGSVIDVEDFNSVDELAAYLNYLDTNENEYVKYFEWKKEFIVHSKQNNAFIFKASFCELCKKLHKPIQRSVYDSINRWWWECKDERKLPLIVRNVLYPKEQIKEENST